MSKRNTARAIVARAPGVELLRLAHKGAKTDDPAKHVAAASIYSLLALCLRNEMVDIPKEMANHYEVLAR
jgi:hypothetical protein